MLNYPVFYSGHLFLNPLVVHNMIGSYLFDAIRIPSVGTMYINPALILMYDMSLFFNEPIDIIDIRPRLLQIIQRELSHEYM